MTWLAIALGGALGALSRYSLIQWLPPISTGFPWATFVANILGAVLIGISYVLIVEKGIIPLAWRPLVMVGFLGALTTFSTFSLDAYLLWQMGQGINAVVYVMASVLGCIACTTVTVLTLQKLV